MPLSVLLRPPPSLFFFFLQNNKLLNLLTNIHNNSICDTSNVAARPVRSAKCGSNGGAAHGQSAGLHWRERASNSMPQIYDPLN